MVLGWGAKSEDLWEIMPSISNLQSANSTNAEQISQNKAEIEMNFAMIGNSDDEVKLLEERIKVLENHHGKINSM